MQRLIASLVASFGAAVALYMLFPSARASAFTLASYAISWVILGGIFFGIFVYRITK
jgi:hypothetical protein